MGRDYTISRYFSAYSEHDGTHLTHDLMNMMNDIKNKLYSENVYTSIDINKVLWIMTRDTFTWIVNNCDGEAGFYYQVELSCIRPNRYTIMDVEVMFVDDEHMDRCRIVKLSYKESDFHNVSWLQATELLGNAYDSMKYMIRNDIEVRKEKDTMPIYVAYGKKVTIENVIFNNPATIVFWSDGTKTVVKRQKGDKKFDPEKGLAMAICKKIMGNKGNFNNTFKEWIEEE